MGGPRHPVGVEPPLDRVVDAVEDAETSKRVAVSDMAELCCLAQIALLKCDPGAATAGALQPHALRVCGKRHARVEIEHAVDAFGSDGRASGDPEGKCQADANGIHRQAPFASC